MSKIFQISEKYQHTVIPVYMQYRARIRKRPQSLPPRRSCSSLEDALRTSDRITAGGNPAFVERRAGVKGYGDESVEGWYEEHSTRSFTDSSGDWAP